ncbi:MULTISPECIES: hypothetical protein [unclassified Ensifer]|uniref:hypothetical protein n=1 Tax=unclassified Ensifer TaxID=2633371 RepID=UPI0030100E80
MTRFGCVIMMLLASAAIFISAALPIPVKLVWNTWASAPIGLYAIEAPERLEVTHLVVVSVPEPLVTLLSDCGYVPRGVPLIKHIAALRKSPNHRRWGHRRRARSRPLGRDLPAWQGCRRLQCGAGTLGPNSRR